MGALIWYLVVFLVDGILVIQVLAQFFEREIGFLQMLVALLLLGALNGFMLLHATDPIGPAIALLIIAFAALYRLLWRLATERQMATIAARDLAEYRRTIEQRPDLPYPYLALGDYFFDRKMWADAIVYYQKFLERQKDPEVLWKLRKAQEELAREEAGLRQCPQCHADIPRDAKTCPHCGYYIRGLVLDGMLKADWRVEAAALAIVAAVFTVWGLLKLLRIDVRLVLAIGPMFLLAAAYRVLFLARLARR